MYNVSTIYAIFKGFKPVKELTTALLRLGGGDLFLKYSYKLFGSISTLDKLFASLIVSLPIVSLPRVYSQKTTLCCVRYTFLPSGHLWRTKKY